MSNKSEAMESFVFPQTGMVGSLGDLARTLANGTEVPEEFYFACALTLMGAAVGDRINLDVGFHVDPRLYTILLGESYSVKKSTAVKKTVEFFQQLGIANGVGVCYGVGSAEGLARELRGNPNLVIVYDELRALVDKSAVRGSTLLPMVTSLFEQTTWQNATRSTGNSVSITNAHLSILACCTRSTYEDVWGRAAIAIGLPNRLFVVNADAKAKVAWPKKPDRASLEAIKTRLLGQLARLPIEFKIADDAKIAWEKWYIDLPNSEHCRRLDTIGFRLLALMTLTMDKDVIDVEVVDVVTSILNYELNLRILTDPIDADTTVAKLEEKIRRVLATRSCSPRALRLAVHADRTGIWAFERALENLKKVGEIELHQGMYRRLPVDEPEAA